MLNYLFEETRSSAEIKINNEVNKFRLTSQLQKRIEPRVYLASDALTSTPLLHMPSFYREGKEV